MHADGRGQHSDEEEASLHSTGWLGFLCGSYASLDIREIVVYSHSSARRLNRRLIWPIGYHLVLENERQTEYLQIMDPPFGGDGVRVREVNVIGASRTVLKARAA